MLSKYCKYSNFTRVEIGLLPGVSTTLAVLNRVHRITIATDPILAPVSCALQMQGVPDFWEPLMLYQLPDEHV